MWLDEFVGEGFGQERVDLGSLWDARVRRVVERGGRAGAGIMAGAPRRLVGSRVPRKPAGRMNVSVTHP